MAQHSATTYALPGVRSLEIAQGSLTHQSVDAIVNAANKQLAHGGGIAAAIVRRGGAVIQRESDAWVQRYGPITNETTAYTNAGALPCRYIIHAVGPIMGEGDEDRKLADALHASLRRADALGLQSIAFPAISTGIFGYPKPRAARIFFQAIPDYFAQTPNSSLRLVRVVLREDDSLAIFLQAAQQAFDQASQP